MPEVATYYESAAVLGLYSSNDCRFALALRWTWQSIVAR